MATNPLPRLRRVCLALPQSVEVEAWGTATFRCGKIFAMFSHSDDVVHSGGRPGVWLKAGPGNQELMIRDDPKRFFRPPYVGAAGWIGVRLDEDPPWDEIAVLVEDSWRLIAPKKLLKAFDEAHAPVAATTLAKKAGAKKAGAKKAGAKKAGAKKAVTKKTPTKKTPTKKTPAKKK